MTSGHHPPRTHARELAHVPTGTPVRLQGWVHRRRELSAVSFLILRDRTGLAQVVVKGQIELPPEETPVEVVGTAVANPQAPGGVEVVSPTVIALSDHADTPAVELWRPRLDTGLPTLLDHAATTWRHPRQRAVWELAAASLHGFRATLDASGYTEVHSPKLVESATESGASVFEVDYFGRPAYLAQSPQFYKQILVGIFERVYEVGPVFRAEPHDTVRHLAEYVSLDVELGFVRDHHDVIDALRDVLAGMVEAIHERAGHAVELLGLDVPRVPERLPVLHFREALEIAGAPADEPDLAPAHERALGAWARAEHDSDFLIVHGYPTAHRAFYSHPDPEDPQWSRSFDLIFRGLELVSGAQRLHRYADYVRTLEERGYLYAPYASYVEAFRRGIPPHGGFAIGLERWVGRLTGAANIREVTLFPRDLHRLAP
ncbi:MAG TPA: aspartate--tRNA(Asn) ligase [Nocardioides bacterium]|uniref:aspartate--tRNA(Asn) ligase n=1 Tax=uncultured Nocardioides sp. TaxID=198441 RepID=UPI000EB9BC05|nr:aspartate--tRNA(Asn) ligase [uncultured Nocardioides sp.]HCB07013.1 aspartate--tRNA(Asn) ligase [Nocardioides sp.]HRD63403.1 aspartate--tRNA(Asn) ligase [Nocardioides sp.]HRK46610.1 aspartate--tRNA(Asn) ligase [Nocardioides sp.]